MQNAGCRASSSYKADETSALANAAIALEKGHYPFKNYRHARSKSVLFCGCNFPSLYPETCRTLVAALAEHGVGVAYDCCGMPLAMMGRSARFEAICKRIGAKLSKLGVEELVCVCPNCYYALRDRIPQRAVSVYAKLAELGLGSAACDASDCKATLFPPCPDRREGIFMRDASPFLPLGVRTPGCPGQKGACVKKETCQGCSALPCCRQDCSAVISPGSETLTLCASCSGYLAAAGHANVSHALTRILKTAEQPDLSRSFINRAKTLFL